MRPRLSARGLAIAALAAAEEGARANLELPALLASSDLDQRDRAFSTELTYGTLRMLRACDWLIGQFAGRKLEPAVRAAARAGVYQLVFMRVPAYAAVSATVAEGPRRAQPLLNAVLRRVAALVDAGPVAWPDQATELSYPDWVIGRLVQDLGHDRAIAALRQMNSPASAHLRPDGYVQDPASQMVGEHMVALLEGRPPGPVLDVCAAPGGKATLLAQAGRLVAAADIAPERVATVAANAARLGVGNVTVLVADATAAPFRLASAAGVLVDAPCSGLGVLRRRPDAR
ncbi:MAG TPA: transcription antitermination factor NusB, partial [Acidimicrobiales bacterium]|nr:transcription antitermination factor NusB [Acidimicrobiales bacterium]